MQPRNYPINTVSCQKKQSWLKNRNNNKRLPCCVQNILSLKRISASFKKKSNKTNFCTYIQNNFFECYYEEVGDEEVILSPTNSSPDCWLMVWMNSCLEMGLWYTFNRCPFTTKEVCSSSIVFILTEPLLKTVTISYYPLAFFLAMSCCYNKFSESMDWREGINSG